MKNEVANGMWRESDGTAPDRVDLRTAFVALLISRLVVWVAGLAAIAVWGIDEDKAVTFDRGGLTRALGEPWTTLLAPAARWDSVWFLGIAADGYRNNPDSAAFFPLYPGLIALLTPLLGASIAGLVISLVCFYGALVLIGRLTAIEFGPRAGRYAIWTIALFPGSLWFSAIYSESLFLFLSLSTVLAARNGRWVTAAVCGVLAASTRSAGVLLALPLILLWLDARRTGQATSGYGLLAAPAVGLGLLATCVTVWTMGRGFTAPFAAQDTWHRSFRGPFAGLIDGTTAAWAGMRQLAHGSPPPVYFPNAAGDTLAIARHNLLLWIVLVIAVVFTVLAWRKLRLADAAYTTIALMLPLSYPVVPQPLMSMPRFVAVLYPLFIVAGVMLARLRGKTAHIILVLVAVGLAAVSALFSCWRWVA